MRRLLLTISVLTSIAALGAAQQQEKKKDWSHHSGNLHFIVGYEKGMAEVAFTGKPAMVFFTATW